MGNEILEGGMVEEALTKLDGEMTEMAPDSLESLKQTQLNSVGAERFKVEKRGEDYIAIDQEGSEYKENEETGEWEKIADGQKDD